MLFFLVIYSSVDVRYWSCSQTCINSWNIIISFMMKTSEITKKCIKLSGWYSKLVQCSKNCHIWGPMISGTSHIQSSDYKCQWKTESGKETILRRDKNLGQDNRKCVRLYNGSVNWLWYHQKCNQQTWLLTLWKSSGKDKDLILELGSIRCLQKSISYNLTISVIIVALFLIITLYFVIILLIMLCCL